MLRLFSLSVDDVGLVSSFLPKFFDCCSLEAL